MDNPWYIALFIFSPALIYLFISSELEIKNCQIDFIGDNIFLHTSNFLKRRTLYKYDDITDCWYTKKGKKCDADLIRGFIRERKLFLEALEKEAAYNEKQRLRALAEQEAVKRLFKGEV